MTAPLARASAKPNWRVALVSIGIGRVRRGYERYFGDLFAALYDRLDITLFKGEGRQDSRQRRPALLGPMTSLVRLLPLGTVASGSEYRHYKHDCLAYALSLLPVLLFGRYHVVHVIDYPLAKALAKLRRWLPVRARVLYSNACCAPPQYCPEVDHIHHIAEPFYRQALAAGVPPSYLTCVPCGVQTERFQTPRTRGELRREHNIGAATFVILAVTAVKRPHKRVDHLIDEVSQLEGDVLLWIDGNPEDQTIPALARARLGTRCRITHVDSSELAELYGLADVMVHGALEEAFGLAVVEAMATGLPVLAHRSPHFQWLVGEQDCLVDMAKPGALADRLRRLRTTGLPVRSAERAARVHARFHWSELTEPYLAMYRTALPRVASPPPVPLPG